MGTLIKRKGIFPSMMKKSVKNFFDDFITSESFDSTDRNLVVLNGGLTSVNLKEIDTNIEVELAKPKMKSDYFKFEVDNDTLMFFSSTSSEGIEKKDKLIGLEFNYRSFCRLPNP